MKITRTTMDKAAPHIKRAKRSLEMLEEFVRNPQHLALDHRVDQYFNSAAEAILELQEIFLTNDEYREKMAKGLRYINQSREYTYKIQENNEGDAICTLRAVMPMKRMKQRVLFVNKERKGVYTVPRAKSDKQRAG